MKPWDEPAPMKKCEDIFLSPKEQNEDSDTYVGYIVNISHPRILPLLDWFRKDNKIPVYAALDKKQRADFERYIISLFPSEFAQWHNYNQKGFRFDPKMQKWLKILGVC